MRFLFSALLASVVLGCATSLRAADAKINVQNSQVVTMSPFETLANSVSFQKWIKLESPHYVLYTDASVEEGTRVLRQNEMLRAAAQGYFRRVALAAPSVILILPTLHSDWTTISSKGAEQWQIAGAVAAKDIRPLLIAAPDWDENGLAIVHGLEGLVEVNRVGVEGPFWFSQGVMHFFSTAEFDDDKVILGRAAIGWVMNTRQGNWLPWDRFFRITNKSPEFREEARVGQYTSQCALFAQYLMTSRDPAQMVRFLAWISLMNGNREPSETHFKELFGKDWKQWQVAMTEYVAHGEYTMSGVKMPPDVTKAVVTSGVVPVREMRDLFVLTRILHQDVPESAVSLDALLTRGLKTESLRELLFAACREHDRRDAAMVEAAKMMDAGTQNPAIYAEAARLVFEKEISKVNIDSRLSAETANQIQDWCGRALKLEPRFPDANDLLALSLALQPEVTPVDADRVRKIYDLQHGFVSTTTSASALAIARWRSGDSERARQIAEILSASPFSDNEARRVGKQLAERLPADAK